MARQWLLALLIAIGVAALACDSSPGASTPLAPPGDSETPTVSATSESAGVMGDLGRSEATLAPTFPFMLRPSSPGDPEALAKCKESFEPPESYRYTMEGSWGAVDPEGVMEQIRTAKAADLDSLITSGMAPVEAERQVDGQYGDLSDLQDYVAPDERRVGGEFQAPDRWHFTITGGLSLSGEYTVVGDTVWKSEDGAWAVDETVWEGEVEEGMVPLEEDEFCQGVASLLAAAGTDSSEEVVDGVATTHYHLGTKASEEPDTENLLGVVSADSDVWVARDGYWPARMRYEGIFDAFKLKYGEVPEAAAAFGQLTVRLTLDVRFRDLDEPSIRIERPAP